MRHCGSWRIPPWVKSIKSQYILYYSRRVASIEAAQVIFGKDFTNGICRNPPPYVEIFKQYKRYQEAFSHE